MKKFFKRIFKELTIDPNSPEGYAMRANYLVEHGYTEDNPLVSAYRKLSKNEGAP